jgi:hypothetical protein
MGSTELCFFGAIIEANLMHEVVRIAEHILDQHQPQSSFEFIDGHPV